MTDHLARGIGREDAIACSTYKLPACHVMRSARRTSSEREPLVSRRLGRVLRRDRFSPGSSPRDQNLSFAGRDWAALPLGSHGIGDPISLALGYIAFIGLQSSREKSHCCSPVDLRHCRRSRLAPGHVPAMLLGSVLLLGRRSGETSVLSTKRQRPTWGGRDDGERPGQAGADNPFQPGEIHRFAYSVVDFGGFGGECPS